MSAGCRSCAGCAEVQRLGRRRYLKLLATGVALALAGCGRTATALSRQKPRHPSASSASSTPSVPSGSTSARAASETTTVPVELGAIPPSRPGSPTVVSSGPPGTHQVALTLDDGYCGSCIAQFVEFAEGSGMHMTFNPNGVFGYLWTPSIVAVVREMVQRRQVQFGNHTWDHANLLGLSNESIATEIVRNERWIEQTFGVTARPYFRPPWLLQPTRDRRSGGPGLHVDLDVERYVRGCHSRNAPADHRPRRAVAEARHGHARPSQSPAHGGTPLTDRIDHRLA
jgi:peptidoglycan/xylan/chitin deacetylase (PgdA/CDA1 family)